MRSIVNVLFFFFITIAATNLFAVDTAIILINRDGTITTKNYPVETRELRIAGYKVVGVRGLENLPGLRKIVFEMVSIKDFSFLTTLTSLEALVLFSIYNIDYDFIYDLKSIKELVFATGFPKNEIIDVAKLSPTLEYIQCSNSSLKIFPITATGKTNVKIINVAINNITDIPENEYLIDVIIFASYNPLNTKKDNIVMGDYYDIIPPQYKQYAY